MFPLALLNAASPPSPPVDPTGLLLFNGTNGATTTTNSGTIGTPTMFSGASISTAEFYEGTGSARVASGQFVRYTPTAASSNNDLVSRDFCISVAFRVDAIDATQKGILFCENNSGLLLFRLYVQSGVVKCVIRQADGTTYTLTVPTLTCLANTWYEVDLIRSSTTGQFTVKVGANEVSQAFTTFAPTVAYIDMGASWSGAYLVGYVDRFVYQPNTTIPY